MAISQPLVGDFDTEQQRIMALEKLATTLRGFPFDAARAEFSRLFNRAQLVLETDDLELARLLRVSRPTVGRWTRGESAPHPIGRKSVLIVLAKVAEGKLRIHANHQAVGAD
jgi:DNA-binding transcriptional regulator YiaG